MFNRRDTLLMSVAAAISMVVPAMAAGEAVPEPVGTVDVAKLMQPGTLDDMILGNADAPVTIVEYASMACSHCADFTAQTLPAIKQKYISTGKAKLIFREMPLEPRSTGLSLIHI